MAGGTPFSHVFACALIATASALSLPNLVDAVLYMDSAQSRARWVPLVKGEQISRQ